MIMDTKKDRQKILQTVLNVLRQNDRNKNEPSILISEPDTKQVQEDRAILKKYSVKLITKILRLYKKLLSPSAVLTATEEALCKEYKTYFEVPTQTVVQDVKILQERQASLAKQFLELLENLKIDLNAQGKQGFTALMNTAMEGDLFAAQLLIAAGANLKIIDNIEVPNAADQDQGIAVQSTPFALAIYFGNLEVAHALIAAPESDLQQIVHKDKWGMKSTALGYAMSNERYELVNELLDNHAEKLDLENELMLAIINLGYDRTPCVCDTFKRLLSMPGVDVNKRDPSTGETPLTQLAFLSGSAYHVPRFWMQDLIDAGAGVNQSNTRRNTPLMNFLLGGYKHLDREETKLCVELLATHYDFTLQNDEGQTVFDLVKDDIQLLYVLEDAQSAHAKKTIENNHTVSKVVAFSIPAIAAATASANTMVTTVHSVSTAADRAASSITPRAV